MIREIFDIDHRRFPASLPLIWRPIPPPYSDSPKPRKRKEYARGHGNGTRVTEFSSITVAEPRESDRRYVPSGAKLPVTPESGNVLPVKVTREEVDQAIALLAEFPSEPTTDSPGAGVDVLLDHGESSAGATSRVCGADSG